MGCMLSETGMQIERRSTIGFVWIHHRIISLEGKIAKKCQYFGLLNATVASDDAL